MKTEMKEALDAIKEANGEIYTLAVNGLLGYEQGVEAVDAVKMIVFAVSKMEAAEDGRTFEKLDDLYRRTSSAMRELAFRTLTEIGNFKLKEPVPITVRSESNGYKPIIEYIEEVKVLSGVYQEFGFVADNGYEYYPEDIRTEELWELVRSIKEQL